MPSTGEAGLLPVLESRALLLVLSLLFCDVSLQLVSKDLENGILRLKDVPAAEAFINSTEVAVIGFFQTEAARGYQEFLSAAARMKALSAAVCGEQQVWARYGIASDTISIFRKADLHQEHLNLSEAKKVDADGLVRFMTMNNVRYVTEYNQASAVGLFQSEVKTHVLLLAVRGRADSDPLQERFRDLAPKYTGKMLFVLVNGSEKSNARVLEYFGLGSHDLPRVGIYDGTLDEKWLMPSDDITTERVQTFCDSFLAGDLQKQNEAGTPEDKTEL
ncbi:endoplasmic reticulum resident protein 27 [Rhinichthys klamathensis goyatoka]|uniref:endoplasmic reticulum resident protein 27 n=1 Tax=Rhinichthys klamathensis goyatoka TaxID=3034132 RepID=UPI0024B5D577|nr:endoplasmic reticulum resident protein 27 [Rhinichthys klamathensis goyatoka]